MSSNFDGKSMKGNSNAATQFICTCLLGLKRTKASAQHAGPNPNHVRSVSVSTHFKPKFVFGLRSRGHETNTMHVISMSMGAHLSAAQLPFVGHIKHGHLPRARLAMGESVVWTSFIIQVCRRSGLINFHLPVHIWTRLLPCR